MLSALGLLALTASPVAAFWRLPCQAPVVVERADPIINPGVVSPHLHTIMGGNGFGFSMDYAQTQASTCSTCTVQKDLSNYWIPNLWYAGENGTFTSVPQVGGVLVYYLYVTSFGLFQFFANFEPDNVLVMGKSSLLSQKDFACLLVIQ